MGISRKYDFLFRLVLISLFINGCFCLSAFEYEGIEYDILSETEKTAELTRCPVEMEGNVTIPASIAYQGCDYTVVSIASMAFYECVNITGIELPETITSIGSIAFKYSNIIEMTIPDSVIEIDVGAFDNCNELKTIKLSNSIEVIKRSLFVFCRSLTEIIIPESVKEIESYAFLFCPSLERVYIPATVENIRQEAFGECPAEFFVAEDNPNYSAEGGFLMNKERSILYYCGKADDKKAIIPESVTRIESNAFDYSKNINAVVIPAGVTYIGVNAFYGCDFMNEIFCLIKEPLVLDGEIISHPFASYPEVTPVIFVPAESYYSYIYADIWKNYTIFPIILESGVQEIQTDKQGYTVYSIDGRFVMKTENAGNLNSLDRGIYIINGKKVLLNNKF